MTITNCKKKRELFDSGGRCQEFKDICMDFEPCLKVHTLISVQHKSIKLGQMIHLYVTFLVVSNVVVVSNCRLV